METDAPKAKVHKVKGTTTVTLDFDDSDDDIFDEEAKNACASRLSKSTIDVNTCEKLHINLRRVFLRVSLFCFLCAYFFTFDFDY